MTMTMTRTSHLGTGAVTRPTVGAAVGAAPATGLDTDHYELTMIDVARTDGVAEQRAVFEMFARRLPAGRRYGVVAGTERALDAIRRFRFDDEDLEYLRREGIVAPDTLVWLAGYRFAGDVHGLREGEVYVPDTPVLTVEGTFAEAVILETVILSIFNHDTAVASAAARMVSAAQGRRLVEMGGRRTHEDAAVAAARAAYLVGFAATSNLRAGERYGIPTAGTAAHAFTLAYPDECEAFVAQLRRLGPETTLLVDTFDIATGIDHAVAAAQTLGLAGPGAIRIDSGDLLVESRHARRRLDALGATGTRIVVTGDLDESAIDRLVRDGAPVDVLGVGTSVVTGAGHPTADFVYKLVAIADDQRPDRVRPVAKSSVGKRTIGGRKQVWRTIGADGRATGDRLLVTDDMVGGWDRPPGIGRSAVDVPAGRPLQVPLVQHGEIVHTPSLDEVRDHHGRAMGELPDAFRDLTPGGPVLVQDGCDQRGMR